MVSQSGNHALVIGASGLIGWAVVDQLLKGYPAPGTFRKVTAAVNRPLDVNGSYWLADNPDTAELSLASGVDLSKEDDEFAKLLRDKVHDIETISHIYYFGMLDWMH